MGALTIDWLSLAIGAIVAFVVGAAFWLLGPRTKKLYWSTTVSPVLHGRIGGGVLRVDWNGDAVDEPYVVDVSVELRGGSIRLDDFAAPLRVRFDGKLLAAEAAKNSLGVAAVEPAANGFSIPPVIMNRGDTITFHAVIDAYGPPEPTVEGRLAGAKLVSPEELRRRFRWTSTTAWVGVVALGVFALSLLPEDKRGLMDGYVNYLMLAGNSFLLAMLMATSRRIGRRPRA